VQAGSIRLAAVRAEELLDERTLAYDEQAVERVLRRWPAVRCLLRVRADRLWSLPSHCRAGVRLPFGGSARAGAAAGRAIGSRPIRASSRVCSRAGCWSRSVCPRPFRRPPVTWCAPARTRGWIGCPTGAAVEVLPALGAEAADELLDRRSPQVALRVAFPVRGAADHLRFLPPRGRSGRRADRAAGVAQLPTAPSHPGARPRRPGASDRAGP
jgi:hypothetical protein